jgi:hypothetical protein
VRKEERERKKKKEKAEKKKYVWGTFISQGGTRPAGCALWDYLDLYMQLKADLRVIL